MKTYLFSIGMALLSLSANGLAASAIAPDLEEAWRNPPLNARVRAYWWWLNGNVTREAITRDLEEMKARGFGGAIIADAGGAEQDGNDRVPHGPTFFSPEWRELYKHTLREANRLGLEMSLNIQSGWNLGGPMVEAADAAKRLVWSDTRVTGGTNVSLSLPMPLIRSRDNFYQDLFVVAYRVNAEAGPNTNQLQRWEEKAVYRALNFSAPDTTPLLRDLPAVPGEEHARSADVLDLTAKLSPEGVLQWDAPPGDWEILRFGCTVGNNSRVSTHSDGWQGYALDVLDVGAFERYWDAVVEPLILDAGSLAGTTLKYLHTDSWEVEAINWTPTMREQFRHRRGYDLLPFLPVLAGRIVDNRRISNRFLDDFRKTLGDLAADHHYRIFQDRARRHGLALHPESGGPHASPIDAQRLLGLNDAPMSEFWAWSWRHRIGDANRFFVKQPASAAHTMGRRLVLAEGFTTIGPHWQETIWDNLKPSFDKALCEGLNLLVWHAVVCSPAEMGMPGQQYFAGTHFNPNTTWWPKSGPFLQYLNRCQALLQKGLFVADVCYYYGDHVPNFAQHKRSDPARVLPGFDYDVISEEALLERMTVKNQRLTLPDGMSYRVLVLPNRTTLSLPVLRKVKDLIAAGATVVGPKPVEASGLKDFPQNDAELARLTAEIWQDCDGQRIKERPFGSGRIVSGKSARDVLTADNLKPDFEFHGAHADAMIDYIHRSAAGAEIYFVANRSNRWEDALCTFRVAGKAPEIWDPVSGERRFATAYTEQDGRIGVPLEFSPCGSWFVVFREPARQHPATAAGNSFKFEAREELSGPWTVKFDPKWGGPESTTFERLVSWTTRTEPGIKYYSGTAKYVKSFDLPAGLIRPRQRLWLDLGNVRELAEVRLNGKPLGILWAPPFRVEITSAVKATGNALEIEVVNFWPNRIIGDQFLPREERRTRTNIRKLTRETALMDSGLFGPIRVLEQR